METTYKKIESLSHTKSAHNLISYWKRFVNWSAGQEENRLLWTAIAIFGHGCIITVLTILVVVLTGNNFIYWPFVILAMAASVVSYLASMPTKVTIPIFFLSVLLDLVIIISCLFTGFSSSTYI